MTEQFNDNDIQKTIEQVAQNLNENTEKYLQEKRFIFQHFTLLIATILGFSISIVLLGNGEINCILKISWIIQILTIFLGAFFLIFESETRYQRGFIAASSMLEISQDVKNKGGFWDEIVITHIIQKTVKDLSGSDPSKNKSLRKKIFDWFTRNIRHFEITFYILFFLSIASLAINFLII